MSNLDRLLRIKNGTCGISTTDDISWLIALVEELSEFAVVCSEREESCKYCDHRAPHELCDECEEYTTCNGKFVECVPFLEAHENTRKSAK